MRSLLLCLLLLTCKCMIAQTYTTGAANWTSTWIQNSGSFDFTNGVGLYTFNSAANDGATFARLITTDGTAGGTPATLNSGQKLTIRLAGHGCKWTDRHFQRRQNWFFASHQQRCLF